MQINLKNQRDLYSLQCQSQQYEQQQQQYSQMIDNFNRYFIGRVTFYIFMQFQD
ncbi:unnamed protein product [Paramecium pentaurelia]|uniref:Uncharacterized protein n=1 Tax=Paramecium pentaurelia TaxID=43138 RepID=A0A8S1SJ85_9CILI|nr:unnamed protein product [Paramecium pentaurelia]